jgi:hypothetical protein
MIKSRRMMWAVHVAHTGEKMSARRILVEKAEGNIPLGGLRCRFEDTIKMDLRELGWSGLD